MITRFRNELAKRRLLHKARQPYVTDGPLIVLPGVLDPVATKVGAWLAEAMRSEVGAGERWADMGCGTGVVGIAMAEAGARVTCIDIDPDAVRNARANAALRNLPVEVVESDLFAHAPGPFDGVVYNVPFWPGEPDGTVFSRAFYAGRDFAAIRTFVAIAPAHARRVLVALSEAGTDHAAARNALGTHRVLKRERHRSEWMVLCASERPR